MKTLPITCFSIIISQNANYGLLVCYTGIVEKGRTEGLPDIFKIFQI